MKMIIVKAQKNGRIRDATRNFCNGFHFLLDIGEKAITSFKMDGVHSDVHETEI
ncbi:MAG: hypothetical protein P8N56_03145 [Schleiferiaceae bacterium]|nr:hypothetical protein [Schleiferiaceae bacterium]